MSSLLIHLDKEKSLPPNMSAYLTRTPCNSGYRQDPLEQIHRQLWRASLSPQGTTAGHDLTRTIGLPPISRRLPPTPLSISTTSPSVRKHFSNRPDLLARRLPYGPKDMPVPSSALSSPTLAQKNQEPRRKLKKKVSWSDLEANSVANSLTLSALLDGSGESVSKMVYSLQSMSRKEARKVLGSRCALPLPHLQ